MPKRVSVFIATVSCRIIVTLVQANDSFLIVTALKRADFIFSRPVTFPLKEDFLKN